ncbi:MAG TPA: hypothetical protein VHG90_14255 [Acidimicrobiales bacterium]|nr:hypothetical protein [Acidimicrobiales bacterium]
MSTTKEAQHLQRQAGSGDAPRGESTPARRQFLRHYLEMVVAMVAGMVVLGAAAAGAEAVTGLALPASPELTALTMAVAMAAGMVVWMRHRGHRWPATLEMAGAMLGPAVALMPLLWLGVIGGDAFLALEHTVMLPLMYLVMRRRRSDFGG